MMNKIIIWSICLIACSLFACKNSSIQSRPDLVLKTDKLDFGIIQSADTLWQDVLVKNNGNAPLIIEEVNVSCGCTFPKWSTAPILPGQNQIMKVGLIPETVAQGKKLRNTPFSKSIVIRSNTDKIFTSLQVVGIIDNMDS